MSIKVDQALISSFIAGSFGLPIAHEGVAYTPTPGTAYAEITVFDAGSDAATLNSWDEAIGIFQVVLRYPVNTGAVAAKNKAEEIFSHFFLYSNHTYSDQSVQMTNGQTRANGYNEDGWYKIVLRMPYRAFTER